jgi:hypothetical protein
VFDFLTKIVADSNKELMDKISELAPIIIIGLIWLFSAIAKAVAGKKGEQPQMEQKAKGKPAQPGFVDLIKMVRQKYSEAQEQIRKETEQGAQRFEPPALSSVEGPAQPTRPKPATVPPHQPRPQYKLSVTPGPVQIYGPRQMEKTIKPPLLEKTIPVAQEDIDKPVPSLKEVKISETIHKLGPHPYLAELLKEYAQPNGLRKAFLNYEIFGKPLALRDSIQPLY